MSQPRTSHTNTYGAAELTTAARRNKPPSLCKSGNACRAFLSVQNLLRHHWLEGCWSCRPCTWCCFPHTPLKSSTSTGLAAPPPLISATFSFSNSSKSTTTTIRVEHGFGHRRFGHHGLLSNLRHTYQLLPGPSSTEPVTWWQLCEPRYRFGPFR